jgi:hypothetical protein
MCELGDAEIYIQVAEVFKQFNKPQEVSHYENLKSLSEIATLILTSSEDNEEDGHLVFDAILNASHLYS